MRIVIQRVKRASVSVEEKVVGSIQKGFLGSDRVSAKGTMKQQQTSI